MNKQLVNNNDIILAEYGIYQHYNDLDTLKKNINNLNNILNNNLYDSSHHFTLRTMLGRFNKRYEKKCKNIVIKNSIKNNIDTDIESKKNDKILYEKNNDNILYEKNNDKIIDNLDNIIATTYGIFRDIGKYDDYAILIFKPRPTELNPVPQVYVLCNTTNVSKMMMVPLIDTLIGTICKNTNYFLEKIQLGQWKLIKLGKNEQIFNELTHDILEQGIIIKNYLYLLNDSKDINKLKNFRNEYKTIDIMLKKLEILNDSEIDLNELYNRYQELYNNISDLEWTSKNIPKHIGHKLSKWIGTRNVIPNTITNSKEMYIIRANGNMKIFFKNNKSNINYIDIIPFVNTDEESDDLCDKLEDNPLDDKLWQKLYYIDKEKNDYKNNSVNYKQNTKY